MASQVPTAGRSGSSVLGGHLHNRWPLPKPTHCDGASEMPSKAVREAPLEALAAMAVLHKAFAMPPSRTAWHS
eukprot:6313211-Alexandrium_andersonii.AAC.1